MAKKGYIQLSRKFFEHHFWKEDRPFSNAEAWLDLISSARFEVKPEKILVKMKIITINRGELRASQRFLAGRWKWSTGKVYRFLKILENERMVERRQERSETIIIITNYKKFNILKDDTMEHQQNTDRDTAETPTETPVETEAIHRQRQTKEREESKEREEGEESKLDYSEITDFYNQTCTSLNSIKKLTEKRKGFINARVREYGIESVKEMITKASQSNFLSGQNKKGWTADFDWIMRPNNFIKVLEDKYSNGKNNKSNTQQRKNSSAQNFSGKNYDEEL